MSDRSEYANELMKARKEAMEAHAALEVILALVSDGDKSTEPDVARRMDAIYAAARMALGR